MFCNKCGGQLPEGSKFCNFCGAKLENTTPVENNIPNTTGSNQNSNSPAPKKSSNILVSIIVAVIFFFIGYFVVSPLITDSFTDGNSKDKSNTSSTSDSNKVYETDRKAYKANAETIMSSYIQCLYNIAESDDDANGTIKTIIGSYNVYNADQQEDVIQDLKKIVTKIEETISKGDYKTSSIEFKENDNNNLVTVSFTFYGIDSAKSSDLLNAAADFLGVKTKNKKLYIDDVEDVLLDSGYTIAD